MLITPLRLFEATADTVRQDSVQFELERLSGKTVVKKKYTKKDMGKPSNYLKVFL
jgi:hypothetical protein